MGVSHSGTILEGRTVSVRCEANDIVAVAGEQMTQHRSEQRQAARADDEIVQPRLAVFKAETKAGGGKTAEAAGGRTV